ncbi:MAG: hypothetical protein K2X01_02875 [Cyanobacteria bacterium]|nr:hypothetical protein [Cyanobacteriota bacterium]
MLPLSNTGSARFQPTQSQAQSQAPRFRGVQIRVNPDNVTVSLRTAHPQDPNDRVILGGVGFDTPVSYRDEGLGNMINTLNEKLDAVKLDTTKLDARKQDIVDSLLPLLPRLILESINSNAGGNPLFAPIATLLEKGLDTSHQVQFVPHTAHPKHFVLLLPPIKKD